VNKLFTIVVALALTTSANAADKEPVVNASKPNIIYINTDDWGIGKVPSYQMDEASQKIIKTPNLDQLRRDGALFTNAYAGNAVCGPSRCTLLTGKHPGNAAWRANAKDPTIEQWPPKYPMLGEVARNAGYKTAAFGKVSAGGHHPPEHITLCGWDYWLGYLGHVDVRDFYANYIWENGEKIDLPKNTKIDLHKTILNKGKGTGGVVGINKGTFVEDLYTDKIIEFMKENKEQPFFVYFASTVPHGGRPGGMRVPDLLDYDKVEGLTRSEQVYCALMTYHDRSVGRIRSALKELGLDQNTIVIWTSDNGDESSYYLGTKTFDGNGPFKKAKRSLHEGGIRVPMIAVWPGKIEPNSTCDLITTQVDVMPTVADAGGKELTSEMDGISIMPTLRGERDKQTKREYIYFEFYERGQQQSVRMGKWKAFRVGGWDAKLRLYDLSKDIGEEKDIAAQLTEIVQRMKEIMKKEHSPHPLWNLESKKSSDKKKSNNK